jgi:glycyl-tRNA synthetase
MIENGEITVKVNDKEIKLAKALVEFEQLEKIVQEEKYIPSVIEPSFGIGRIVYCIFEHCFKMRAEDEQRTYFDFPAHISPLKCSILPLIDNDDLNRVVAEISKNLTFLTHL